MEGDGNEFVPIPPFLVPRGGKHFVPSFQTEEASLERILSVETSRKPWKKLFSVKGERVWNFKTCKEWCAETETRADDFNVSTSTKQGANDTLLESLRYTSLFSRICATTPA